MSDFITAANNANRASEGRQSSPAWWSNTPLSQSTAAIFDQSVDILKANAIPLLLITAVVLLPVQLVSQFMLSRWIHPASVAAFTPGDDWEPVQLVLAICGYAATGVPQFAFPGVLLLGASMLASGPISTAVVAVMSQQRITVVGSLRRALGRIIAICSLVMLGLLCCVAVWVFISTILGVIGFVLLFFFSTVVQGFAEAQVGGTLMVIYIIVCIVVPYVITCLFYGRTFAFCIPVLVNERTSVMESVGRSQQLVSAISRRSTLMIFAVLPLLIVFVQYAIMFGCDSVIEMVHFSPFWQYAAETAICAITLSAMYSYWMVFVARLYFDLKIKRECLDIRILVSEASNS